MNPTNSALWPIFLLMIFSQAGINIYVDLNILCLFVVIPSSYSLHFLIFVESYDPLDPFGNITIKWDVISWTPDGYVALVTMNNFQMYRHIMSPGWTLGWGWAKKEVIWSMVGAQATEQGDCSKFKGNVPHCCKRNPIVVDLLPGVPYNQQIANCCKGGVVASWGQDPSSAVSSFQVSVGLAGTSNKTVKLPKNFTLLGPGPGYTCGPAKIVPSTWTLVAQHPNLNNVTQVFSFDYKPLVPYQSINDTGMFYGMKFYNDLLMEAGNFGNVQTEVLLKKDKDTFTLKQGWAFPRKIYFNGDECQLPPPDAYPVLPNSAQNNLIPISRKSGTMFLLFVIIFL
ncbi:hypothetical protein RD792_014935 [Penstemon davidsonii]|uniref:COBRA-like protein n=1 Tax=Penstemon davidsonii TaxID=160366 RepID=A0ABR0CSH2_9LAMI|nr:hypothetical protein RD792_014935 [Penstemon davidsonii]